jgi:Ca-activated chloride channel family protein
VVFLVDRSGSMGGWKMVAARRAAARMIDTLTSRDRFCAIAFDDRVELLPEASLVDATDRQRFRAVEALARVGARGGTEIAQPLRLALGLLVGGTADRERVIVLVTDGQVGNEDQILRELAPALRNVKMFTLGIDQAVNAAFLRRMAAAGGGLCELVESEDRLDEVMAKVHRRIGTPIATELALRPTGLDVDRSTLSPAKLPDVYAGAPVVIFGRYRGAVPAGATIDVEGSSLGDPLKMSLAVSRAAPASTWLAASWARAHLRDLEDRYAAGSRGELEPQIVRVSKQFGVLSRFTAFVAVDRSQVVNQGGVLHQAVQPVELPAGWQGGAGGAMTPPGGMGLHRVCSIASAPARQMPMMMGMAPPAASAPAPAPAQPGYPPPPMSYGSGAHQDDDLELRLSSRHAPGMNADEPEMDAMMADSDLSDVAVSSLMASDDDDSALSNHRGSGPPIRQDKSLGRVAPPAAAAGRGRPSGYPPPPQVPAQPLVESPAAMSAMYLKQLVVFALQLGAQATGGCDPTALRLIRQRLGQWIEDLRSVGGTRDLISAVEVLVQRLSDALAAAAPADLAAELTAISDELATIATGAPPPPPKKTRLAFWK